MKSNHVRIIGGRWRGRKISFPDLPALRPSPDRVRETLFNWLMPLIVDAHCLDCFAGSGVLGFEALSRGAKQVVMADRDPLVIRSLESSKADFKAEGAIIRTATMPLDLRRFQEPYDIVFVDPPFKQGLVLATIDALSRSASLKPGSVIYLETELTPAAITLPPNWQVKHHGHAGMVNYFLCVVAAKLPES